VPENELMMISGSIEIREGLGLFKGEFTEGQRCLPWKPTRRSENDEPK